jgi:hypothetical protein
MSHSETAAAGTCQLINELCEALDALANGAESVSWDGDTFDSADDLRDRAQEWPLSVLVRSDRYAPGKPDTSPTEFELWMCTGGPAVRMRGDLSEYGEPTRAYVQHQDWGTGWRDYVGDEFDSGNVLRFASMFYYAD